MNEQLVQEILSRLDTAGELAVEGFSVLMRQVYIDAMMMGGWTVFLLVVAYVCYRLVRNYGYLGGEHIWSTGSYEAPELGGAVFGMAGTGALFGAFGLITGIIGRLANPEFYALKWVLQSVGS